MGRLSGCVCYIHLQSLVAWNQKSVATRTTTLGSTGFGNPSVQNQVEEVDQWHSQEPYFGTHDCGNLCRWISKAWAAACTHSFLYQTLQVTHGRGCRPHDQCWTSKFKNKQVGPRNNCQMHDAWSMWSCVSKCPVHGKRQMQKTISTQVPIRDDDGCKRIPYLSA